MYLRADEKAFLLCQPTEKLVAADFKMNVLMLDDLLPVKLGFTETKPDKEVSQEGCDEVLRLLRSFSKPDVCFRFYDSLLT